MICQDLPGSARICQDLPGSARICQNLPESPETSKSAQNTKSTQISSNQLESRFWPESPGIPVWRPYFIDRFIGLFTLQMTGQVEDRFWVFDVRLPTKQSFFALEIETPPFFSTFQNNTVTGSAYHYGLSAAGLAMSFFSPFRDQGDFLKKSDFPTGP